MTETSVPAGTTPAARSTALDLLAEAIDTARRAGHSTVPEPVGKRLLRSYDVPVPCGTVVNDQHAVESAITRLHPPYVLKTVAPSLVHKSEVGGVRVGLSTATEIADAMAEIRRDLWRAGHPVQSFLVEELAAPGREIVVGAVRDTGSGPVVMLGLGGVFVEVFRDVALRLAPVSRHDVLAMLDELRGRALLETSEAGRSLNVEALVDVVMAVAGQGGLLDQLPADVTELDLNPVIVSEQEATVADVRLVVAPESPQQTTPTPRQPARSDFTPLMAPRTVAVLGASTRSTAPANLFIRNLQDFGYSGEIYPVHPSAERVEGLAAYRGLADTPQPVDYAYVAVPAAKVPGVLAAAAGRVRFAQVISSGFGETDQGAQLEHELVEAARLGGVRVLGPNCLGTYSPRGRLTFTDRAPREQGPVGVISQSGGLSVDILRLGAQRGLGFRGIVSAGNGADVGPSELLEHFLDDSDTAVVGLYLESLAEGRQVLETIRMHPSSKPVVVLAGGRTAAGARAAVSHTGAIAGNHLLWPALARQADFTLVDTLSQFLDALLALQMRDPAVHTTGSSDVVLFGNGGGTSVLATDALERYGLHVPHLPARTLDRLGELNLPPGTSLANPIDAPAWTLAVEDGKIAESILSAVLDTTSPAAIITHLNVGVILSNTAESDSDVMTGLLHSLARVRKSSGNGTHHLLVLRSDGDPVTEDRKRPYREQALRVGLPVFDELADAACAATTLIGHDRLPGGGSR